MISPEQKEKIDDALKIQVMTGTDGYRVFERDINKIIEDETEELLNSPNWRVFLVRRTRIKALREILSLPRELIKQKDKFLESLELDTEQNLSNKEEYRLDV